MIGGSLKLTPATIFLTSISPRSSLLQAPKILTKIVHETTHNGIAILEHLRGPEKAGKGEI